MLLIGALAWGLRSPLRPLLLGGLALMLGGYALTYSVRNFFGPHWLMEVQRTTCFLSSGSSWCWSGYLGLGFRGSMCGRDPHFCLRRSWPSYFWQPTDR